MARPHKERRVEQLPPVTHYKPAGVPLHNLEEITLNIEKSPRGNGQRCHDLSCPACKASMISRNDE